MKRLTLNLASAAPIAALLIGTACAGCSSQGKSNAPAAARAPAVAKTDPALASDGKSPRTGIATWQSVAELRQDVIRSRAQVDATLDALSQLNGQGGGDLRPAYDEFSREVDATQAQSQRVRQQSDGMRTRGREYFRSWQEQSLTINDPSIRTQAGQRQSSVRTDFNRIVASMQLARDSFSPFMTGIQDIRNYLSTDLTPRGVGAIEQAMRRAKEDGAAVQKRLDAVAAELDRATAELSPASEVRTAEAQPAGQAAPAAATIRPREGVAGISDGNAGNAAEPGNK